MALLEESQWCGYHRVSLDLPRATNPQGAIYAVDRSPGASASRWHCPQESLLPRSRDAVQGEVGTSGLGASGTINLVKVS